MPVATHRPAVLRERCFRGSAALRVGLLTRGQLQGSGWRRVFPDVYVDAAMPDTYRLRCEAATLVLPATAILTGRSAACLRGLPIGEPADPVEVLMPPGSNRLRVAGIRVRRVVIPVSDVLPGFPLVTTPARTAWEIASGRDLVEAVVMLDVLLSHGYVQPGTLAQWARERPRSTGARAIDLADGRAESPQESRARVRIVLAGFPRPEPQYRVCVDGGFVARVDLAWPEKKVACEYDGEWHSEPRQLRRDRARLNKLVDAGWLVLHITAPDLMSSARFEVLAAQLRAALASR